MENSVPLSPAIAQLSIDDAAKSVKALYEQGRYQESLEACLHIMQARPQAPEAWINAAVNSVLLGRWQDAID